MDKDATLNNYVAEEFLLMVLSDLRRRSLRVYSISVDGDVFMSLKNALGHTAVLTKKGHIKLNTGHLDMSPVIIKRVRTK